MIATRILPEHEALSKVEQALASGSRIAIDTETNGKDVRDGRGYAMGVSLAYQSHGGIEGLYLPFRHRNTLRSGNYSLNRFLPLLQRIVDVRLALYHNASFDLCSLSTLGLDMSKGNFVCTMIGAHLINENYPKAKSLNECSRVYLKGDTKKDTPEFKKLVSLVGWENIDPDAMAEYGTYDAVLTYRLWEVLRRRIMAEKLLDVLKHKMKMVRILNAMEANGVPVDTELCERMAEIGTRRMFQIQDWELDGFNPGSPKTLQKFLIDDLGLPPQYHPGTGRQTFDKSAMEVYDQLLEYSDDPTAKLILEYRGWQKSVSSNYKPYVLLLSPDGRLRTHFLLHTTVTGRLSSREPNLQQIPRSGTKPWNGKMKSCFIPTPGYRLIEADFSQLEFRLNAAYARQPQLLEIFNAPPDASGEYRDIFAEMSTDLGWDRGRTKTFVYSTSYGAGADRISYVFGVDKVGARRHIDHFYELYPELRTASQRAQLEVERHRKIDTWTGRIRHISSVAEEGHKALNSVIQGGAADIVEYRMRDLVDSGFNSDDCRMLLQVHDSVLFEIREDLVDKIVPEIKYTMENVKKDFDFGVNFRVDIHEWGK